MDGQLGPGDRADTAPRILVVDDNAEVRRLVERLLVRDGYSVVHAENGKQALAAMDATPAPSVVLLDLSMPVMDGWGVLGARRQSAHLQRIPVILLSAVGGPSRLHPYHGIFAVIAKPFDVESLLDAVHALSRPRVSPAA